MASAERPGSGCLAGQSWLWHPAPLCRNVLTPAAGLVRSTAWLPGGSVFGLPETLRLSLGRGTGGLAPLAFAPCTADADVDTRTEAGPAAAPCAGTCTRSTSHATSTSMSANIHARWSSLSRSAGPLTSESLASPEAGRHSSKSGMPPCQPL
eukprot:361082-Chlamydomonas_euryale.AAC.26